MVFDLDGLDFIPTIVVIVLFCNISSEGNQYNSWLFEF